MKRFTQDDYFAAASAQDLFATIPMYMGPACEMVGADLVLTRELWYSAIDIKYLGGPRNILQLDSVEDTAFLAAQIGCEKAGL